MEYSLVLANSLGPHDEQQLELEHMLKMFEQ